MAFNLRNVAVFVFCSVVLVVLASAGKYNEDAQQKPDHGQKEWKYRQRRTNQVWEKAERIGMSPKRLDQLEKELKLYDESAMRWKKTKRDGGDPTGEKEASLRRELSEIMKRYGMGKDALAEEGLAATGSFKGDRIFEDMRLNKLWSKSLASGQFSDEELKELRREFEHHQDKVSEYRLLMDEIQGTDDFNRIDKFNRLDVDEAKAGKDRKLKELELKLKHKSLNDDYKRLEIKMLPEEERGEFVEPRLVKMYKDALASNFTEDELQSLKEELKHFERKLQKHESLQHEALQAEMHFQSKRNSGEKVDPQHHQSLKDRVKDMSKTVKKYFADFTDRISSRKHNEL
ncbi:alpha-2-macroglobulin receptor-associated protein-like [Saccoglossus kowalevskii]|uniref:Alpha-2-macroglobulin receptor-associated protein-like n=1 Tax=Saccoglossus kowalevskii TaxID=10224 RepID=A0ABM0GJ17_SACKO|nr:PREDICTED: alpha-2-macroglobulin receptor-associated protein-like [Saccoglossus kowalevskii]